MVLGQRTRTTGSTGISGFLDMTYSGFGVVLLLASTGISTTSLFSEIEGDSLHF
jgi:hypothetical protein